ncbi:hypothetical protein Tco_0317074 [Tanacetum coccineum]
MEDPNITVEEYIKLEDEKACRRGKVYNWETATYGKIWYDDDIHDLRSVETEFPAIVFNDELTSEKALSCEPTVNSENDNEKVNMPSFSSPEPTVSYFDDLDFLKDFKNEFPASVYNDALTSKTDSSIGPIEIPHRINEFDLKTETSLSECDEKEQNAVYFNDLFPFNIIYPDDLKSDKDNDDNEIDIIQSLEGNVINTDNGAYAHGSNKLLETSHDTSNKSFKTETFIKELRVNIVAWNCLNNGMLLNLIKNLYVSFGIPFDLSDFIRMVFRQGSCGGQGTFFYFVKSRKIGLQERIPRIR